MATAAATTQPAAATPAQTTGQPGALIQMQAIGAHDVYLTSSPQVTLFPDSRKLYARHSPFAIDNAVAVQFPMPVRFGRTSKAPIPSLGDLLADVMLELHLPALPGQGGRWVRHVGYVMLRRARLFVNEVLLHDQERLWYDIYDKMFVDVAKSQGLHRLLGADRELPTDEPHTLLVPLKFLCCAAGTRRQQYLPMIALSGASVSVEVELESMASCIVGGQAVSGNNQLPAALPGTRLLCDFVWLGQQERATLLAQPIDIMYDTQLDVETTNFTTDFSGTIRRVYVDLREVNHPVRALVIVAYRDAYNNTNDDYFRYLDVVRGATLLIGADERFETQDGGYFKLVQAYQRGVWPGDASNNVYVYSFALDLSLWNPTGSANFSALDKPVLRIDLDDDSDSADPSTAIKVKVFAMCMSWVRFFQGQAAPLFT